jgi:colanic acid/amylovoran biosynthesis glycosyltransferase
MRGSAPTLSVLTYHRIGDPRLGPPGIVSATPRTFERQMRWLANTGRAVSLDDVLRARDGGDGLPRHAVLVTFDDAYRDFETHAWPVMRRLGVPAVLFVPTSFPDSPDRAFWWDRLFAAVEGGRGDVSTPLGRLSLGTRSERWRAYRALREHVRTLPHDRAMALVDELVERLGARAPETAVLSWAALQRLAAEGVALGAHSRTHPLLHRLPADRVAEEIAGSVDDLRRRIGRTPAAFAFPGGGVPSDAARVLEQAGVRVAFTTARGVNQLDRMAWLELGRINVGRRTPPAALRAQLAVRPRGAPRSRGAANGPRVAYVMARAVEPGDMASVDELIALQRSGVPVDVYALQGRRGRPAGGATTPLAGAARCEPLFSWPTVVSQLHWLRRRPDAYLRAWRDVLAGSWPRPGALVDTIGLLPKVAHSARQMQAAGVIHVHCHGAGHPATAGLVVGRLTGIPFSFTVSGADLRQGRQLLRRTLAEAAFATTTSHDDRCQILAECGERLAFKVDVVRAGVDTRLFSPPDLRPRAEARHLTVVCAGSLHHAAGVAHLVDACRQLARDGVVVHCRVIGEGPHRVALAARIRAAGLQRHVVLAGPRSRTELAEELRRADVFVAPSLRRRRTGREPVAAGLVAAMSCGVAVVVTAVPGISELVENRVSGIVVPPGDATAIADALRRLAEDPELRVRLGRGARQRVLAKFDIAATSAELARRFGVAQAA